MKKKSILKLSTNQLKTSIQDLGCDFIVIELVARDRTSLMLRPNARVHERVWLHKSKSLGPLQNLKCPMRSQSGVYQNIINVVAKEFYYYSCSYFRVSQVPLRCSWIQYVAQYVLCAFRTFCNSWNSFLYIHAVLIVIIGPYTFESRIHSRCRTSKHH